MFRCLRDKILPMPLPRVTFSRRQTVLVTGATARLIISPTLHFTTRGASVVVTSRTLSQENTAKDGVERRAEIVRQGGIHVHQLVKLIVSRAFLDQALRILHQNRWAATNIYEKFHLLFHWSEADFLPPGTRM